MSTTAKRTKNKIKTTKATARAEIKIKLTINNSISLNLMDRESEKPCLSILVKFDSNWEVSRLFT